MVLQHIIININYLFLINMAGFCEIISKMIRLIFDFISCEEKKSELCEKCKSKLFDDSIDITLNKKD